MTESLGIKLVFSIERVKKVKGFWRYGDMEIRRYDNSKGQ
jgi:hypothetical protein